MEYVKSYRELTVYKLCRQLSLEIYIISKQFPKEETYSLTDQLRRSSRSVGAQIAEAWAKKKYVKHFIAKLTDADGEQQETQHWIETAHDCRCISNEENKNFIAKYSEIGKMLQSMIDKADLFCKKKADN